MRLVIFWVYIFSLLIHATTISHAQAPSPPAGTDVTFSEIFACQDSTHPEWIEFYNSGSADIDLSTWKIERKSTGDWNAPKAITATVSAGKYLKFDVTNYLNDSGFFLRLKDDTGAVVETFPETETAASCPSGTQLTSWMKHGMDWSVTTSLTPQSTNILLARTTSTPTPSPVQTSPASAAPTATPRPTATPVVTSAPGIQPTSVILSEIYPCQNDGEKEWVELQNTGNSSVTLIDWKFIDDDKNDQPISSLTIAANAYAVVDISKYSKGMLTNTGDVLTLVDALGKNVDSYSYKNCSKDASFAKISGSWQETTKVTKGSANMSESSKTSIVTTAAQLEGDGGDGEQSESIGSQVSSGSGSVLGAQELTQSEDENSKTPTSSSSTDDSQSRLLSYASIATGIVILSGASGYAGWKWWKQRKKKSAL